MVDSLEYIGCCGAYCKSCKAFEQKSCKGCKLGYADGSRDSAKAKCRIKLCCYLENGLSTCADCDKLNCCEIIGKFVGKKGAKYRKYWQALEYINRKGYADFLKAAAKWRNACGRLD